MALDEPGVALICWAVTSEQIHDGWIASTTSASLPAGERRRACIEHGSDWMTELRCSFSLRDSISVPTRNPINRSPRPMHVAKPGV